METPEQDSLAQLKDHQLLEARALEVWLEHPVTKTYLACLDIYYNDLVNDIDSAIEHALTTSNDAFVKTVVHKTGQQFAVKHTGEFEDFIESFGGIIPSEEDDTKEPEEGVNAGDH